VKLELTLRSYDDAGCPINWLASIKRICAGIAQAAGVPEGPDLPIVKAPPTTRRPR